MAGTLRPAIAGLPHAADANKSLLTRTFEARALSAAPLSIFERAGRAAPSVYPQSSRLSPWLEEHHRTAARAWSELNDNAHADRRAPPGRDQGGRGQGKPDRGI